MEGKYARALANGVEVQPLLFEVWGGFSPGVTDLLQRAVGEHGDKLRGHEYDEATWATRRWRCFAVQKVSCALTRAVAYEVARALVLTTARDPRRAAEEAAI